MSGDVDARIRDAFIAACRDELAALKPGNVHVYADGHRMQVADFERSADAAAPHVADRSLPLGERIRLAMLATFEAVGTNTNLGILLLAVPIAMAAERAGSMGDSTAIRRHIAALLAATTTADAESVFAAIRIANPGGLGRADAHDVHRPATVTLLEAMAAAADRDLIARQYVTNFGEVFDPGLATLRRALMACHGRPQATVQVAFAYASTFPDSHVVRKYGVARGAEIRAAFAERLGLAETYDLDGLAAFDAALKADGINPGTTADLTVAALFLDRLAAA